MVLGLLLLLTSMSVIASPYVVPQSKSVKTSGVATVKVDPFSHIEIKSNQATCVKDAAVKGGATLTYADKVCVTFADGSQLTTDKLTLNMETSSLSGSVTNKTTVKTTEKKSLPIKTMQCQGNVFVKFKNRTVRANQAFCNLATGNCTLQGSVVLHQRAEKNSDVPLRTASSKVLINLKTQEVNLQGSEVAPVCTVIELGNVMKKNKVKKSVASEPLKLAQNTSLHKTGIKSA